ncbi:MAG: ribonuclease III [Helicobacter sp.]|nr:ribonuclease III [Helicobacter sp.]
MCDNQTDIKQLEILEQKLGYCFQNKKRLLEALTHRSHKSANNNERLEFLGDAVLDLVIADFLFEKFPQLQEGSLSKMRAAIVNEKSFSQLAQHLGIGDFLLLSNAEENNNGRKKPSILSDTFEAIFGAIYLESNIVAVKKIISTLLENIYPDSNLYNLNTDHKTTLQELTQAHYGEVPTYLILNTTGPDHKKVFEVSVSICGKEIAKATGNSKKKAQQNAAEIALHCFKTKGSL